MRILALLAGLALAGAVALAGDYNSRVLTVSGVTTNTIAITTNDSKFIEGDLEFIDVIVQAGQTCTVAVVAMSNDMCGATTLFSLAAIPGGTNRYYPEHLVENAGGTDFTDGHAPFCIVKQKLQLQGSTMVPAVTGAVSVKVVYESE